MVEEYFCRSVPFGLPFEICESIFCLLQPRDLLSSCLVSIQWNEFIAKSKAFESLWLRIEGRINESLIKRKFKNVRLVKLPLEDVMKTLQMYGETAKRIEIFDCCQTASQTCCCATGNKIFLRSLRKLTLSNISDSLLEQITSFHETLRILNLNLVSTHSQTPRAKISDFLQINENLKEINLYLNESTNIFQNDITRNIKFNLTSIVISFQSNFDIDSITLANVEKFLETQGKTLKTISLINAASLSSLHRVWNNLRIIESLSFFTVDPFLDCESSRPNLKKKESLKTLELHVLGTIGLCTSDIQTLMKTAKNLISLGVWNLNEEIIELAMNLTHLENIFCATMESDCESFFQSLKSKNGFNKKLKLHQLL